MVKIWVEVNIHLRQYSLSRMVLHEVIVPLVKKLQSDYPIDSWHFFFEPEIRLRFLADKNTIEQIKRELESKFSWWEKQVPTLFVKHVFGAHGKAGKTYKGEADYYGGVWEEQYKAWEADANLALSLSSPLNSKKVIEFHAMRRSHLTLNQFGYTRLQEFFFHLRFAFRHLQIFIKGEKR